MSKNLRIGFFGLAGAVAGFALQGCFDAQPTPECSVTITAAALGLGPYYTKLTKVDGTGSCANLTHFYTGLQRFRTKAQGGAFTLAVKPSPVADPYLGYVYSADVDPDNNCENEEDCADCTIELADGGLVISDGGVVEEYTITLDDGGTDVGVGTPDPAEPDLYRPVDDANLCKSVEEPIERRDPTDPDGKNLIALGQMPQFPSNNVCAISDFTGGVQNFGQEDLTLADGTTSTLPAITYKTEFTNFNVVNSTKVPGTAFTADVKLTEGGCVANYKAVGFWPEIHCATDSDCDPNADLDAGRVFGSGINPAFEPKCDTVLEVCVPSVDVATIK